MKLEVFKATRVDICSFPEFWFRPTETQLLHRWMLVANCKSINVNRNRNDNLVSTVWCRSTVAHVVRCETRFDAFPFRPSVLEPDFNLKSFALMWNVHAKSWVLGLPGLHSASTSSLFDCVLSDSNISLRETPFRAPEAVHWWKPFFVVSICPTLGRRQMNSPGYLHLRPLSRFPSIQSPSCTVLQNMILNNIKLFPPANNYAVAINWGIWS